MHGGEKHRHCTRCDRTVHDLTALRESEARQLLTAGPPPCVRYRTRSDGTIIFAPESRRRGLLVWGTTALAACTPHASPDDHACEQDPHAVWCQEDDMVPPPEIPKTVPERVPPVGELYRQIDVPCDGATSVTGTIAVPTMGIPAGAHDYTGVTGAPIEASVKIPAAQRRHAEQPEPGGWLARRLERHRVRKAERRRERHAAKRQRDLDRATRAERRAEARHDRKMALRWRRLVRKLIRRERRG